MEPKRLETEAERALDAALAHLADAERAASGSAAPTVQAVLERVQRPPLVDRMPLACAAAYRAATDLARPAFAASVVAVTIGIGTGAWLATAAHRASEEIQDTGDWAISNLEDASDDGFEAGFLGDAP